MDVKKYDELRKKVKERDFETKNKGLDKWFFKSTYLGNIGSIFFAFFLVFPALEKAIKANLTEGSIGTILAVTISIIILSLFEYIKRIILANLSLDVIKHKWNIFSTSIIWWLFLSTAIVGSSAYLSILGAKEFSETSDKRNLVVEQNIESEADSITNVFNERKSVLINVNDELLKNNSDLRKKISETPINYRNARKEYQDLVDANIKAIDDNEKKLADIDNKLQEKINELNKEQSEKISKNVDEDTSNIILFLLISSGIEFVIIFGIWFREYYDYSVFLLSESKLETIHKKRKNYRVLLQFIYKNGNLGQDEPIIPVSRLKEMVKQQAIVPSPNKLIDEFFRDTLHMGIFKVVGNKKYTAITYENALKKVDSFDDTVRVLENLS